MRTRLEILQLAQQVADAVGDSQEMQDLLRCEAALGSRAEAPLAEDDPDPRVQEYLAAYRSMERLLQQVTGVFLFPLTGRVGPERRQERPCDGCGA